MVLLEVLGGWFFLSCVTAPLIGRFIATNATIVTEDEALAAPALAAPAQAQSY